MDSKIKKLFLYNWKAKILIFLCTFMLWIYVSASQSLIVNFPGSVPIAYQNSAEGTMSVSDTDSVQIKIAVDPINLKQIDESNFQASVDLKNLVEGTYEREILVTSKREDVRIISVNPSRATVRIEKKISKTVPIRVKLDGQAASEYTASETSAEVESAIVSGPEKTVNTIAEVVAPLKLSGESSSFSKTTKLFVYSATGSELKNVEIDPGEVLVRVTISTLGEAKTVGVKINTIGKVANGYWISNIISDPPLFTVSGSRSVLARTKFLETEPIDVSNLSEKKSFSAKLIIPAGLNILDSNQQVKIEVEVSLLSGQ